MRRQIAYLHILLTHLRHAASESFLALLLVAFVFTAPASAATRLQQRSLYMNSAVPGATTSYKVSFRYQSLPPIGSVDMLFCVNPIPYMPCVTPTGLDVSHANLSSQVGEAGFSISTRSTNHLVLTRTPGPVTSALSSYTFDNIVNPTGTGEAFSIRLQTHSSVDTSGPQVDFGSVRGQVTSGIRIEAQVPPMLIFCMAEEVAEGCTSSNDNYYTDMGTLSTKSTLKAQSQMAVGTNATNGFVITVNGPPMSSGTNVIDPLSQPTPSQPGTNQFGVNLVANTSPTIGENPEGTWANAVPTAGYNQPNRYKYIPGDVIAESPHVSLMKKFTVSYIANVSQRLHPGVYTTTITFIASGRF